MAEKKVTKKSPKLQKKVTHPRPQPEIEAKAAATQGKYIFAIGRRKTSVARVKLFPQGSGVIKINKREFEHYFPTLQLQKDVTDALSTAGLLKKVDIEATAAGGGVNSQARAMKLGISRALVLLNPNFKTVLKKQGFMTRDSRKKERKKPGLKRARRAPQWQKR